MLLPGLFASGLPKMAFACEDLESGAWYKLGSLHEPLHRAECGAEVHDAEGPERQAAAISIDLLFRQRGPQHGN